MQCKIFYIHNIISEVGDLLGFVIGIEANGLRVNMGKTKVMRCQVGSGQVEKLGEYSCDS